MFKNAMRHIAKPLYSKLLSKNNVDFLMVNHREQLTDIARDMIATGKGSEILERLDNNCLITNYPNRMADLVHYMAVSGKGTNECLDKDCLPVPVHFYSPIPDIKDLRERNLWDKKSSLAGISLDLESQVEFLKNLGGRFGVECDWPADSTDNPYDFYVNNPSFSYGCAASLYSIIRNFKPSAIIEVGSGNSSLVVSQALSTNSRENPGGGKCQYTIIDPFPRDIIQAGKLPNVTGMVEQRVELLDPQIFDKLGENDILFIDSSHSVKIGSDVNFLILEVLPRLAPGVIIHFHDIHLPFEYSEVYATNPAFRMFWTEAYLLQAFLACNNEFDILLSMFHLMIDKAQDFRSAFPRYDPKKHKFLSSSFWLRRKKP